MKILIASSIDQAALEYLQRTYDVVCAFNASEEELQDVIADREVVVFRSGVKISARVMACAPDLKLLLRAGSGVDNIDLEYVKQHPIRLVRIPGPGAKAVAEMSFALMLGLARKVLQADQLLREGKWAKQEMTGHLLTGKVLGIIGAGNIGSRVGQLGSLWGMQVLGCVEHPGPEAIARLSPKGITLTDCDEVLRRADFVSIHVPLKANTRHMIHADALTKMKPGAFLINLARGGVVDEEALYQALVAGRLRGAALDVHEAEGNGKISPLAGLTNVILTPHIGAGTFDSQREIGEIIIEQVAVFMRDPSGEVTAPGDVTVPMR